MAAFRRALPIVLAAVAELATAARAVRYGVEEGRPQGRKRQAVAAIGPDGVLSVRAASPPRSASRSSKAVRWCAGVAEGTAAAFAGRSAGEAARDTSAHVLAEAYGAVPRWLAKRLPVAPALDGALEPLPFECTRDAARAFGATLGDHVAEFSREGSVEGIAELFGELSAQCPGRCECLAGILSSGPDSKRPGTCTQTSFTRFLEMQQVHPEALRLLGDECSDRCFCLGEVHAALAELHAAQVYPRRFAQAILHASASASMRVLDEWAQAGGKLDEESARRFSSVVARELGPYTMMASDVIAVWVRSRGGQSLAMSTDIYRYLVQEEVHEAFYRCGSHVSSVACVLSCWRRTKAHKCGDGMSALTALALAGIFRANPSDMHVEITEYCRGQQPLGSCPERAGVRVDSGRDLKLATNQS